MTIYAWKRSNNQHFLPHLLLQKCGNATLTIGFALLRKTTFAFHNILNSLDHKISLTNRFNVAVRLFSNRSQMTSKCGKNKKVAHEAQHNKQIKIYGKMPFYFKFRHFDRHENSTDVILCLYKMKRTDWLLCLAKNCDWFKFKIQKIQKNLNPALSSSMRLSCNRS